ncbi:hypothetical protein Q7P37_000894 [Cladosporium fusiforme]
MAQVITVVNKSGKIVKSTKTLAGVFNEAKSAYNERKAELKSSRLKDKEAKEQELKARSQLEALTLDDDARPRGGSRTGSIDGSRTTRRKPVPSRRERPPADRGYSDSVLTGDDVPRRSGTTTHRPSPLRFDNTGEAMYDEGFEPRSGQLTRRHTGHLPVQSRSQPVSRRNSMDDLAYGDLPPDMPVSKIEDSTELREKMTGLQRLLDECNCLQHSAGATIENLQKNPEALAAVGLTLAEISTLVTKLAPGALPGLKASFPAIMALLASPQFAIAAGLTVGVTVIAFGGYKIVKKMQANKAQKAMLEGEVQADQPQIEPAESVDELRELSSIEKWRRGIADEHAGSVGTSVDGEFITPVASKTLIEEGRLTEADFKPRDDKRKKKSRKAESETGKSVRSERSSRSGATSRSKKEKKDEKKEKKKEPSGLKLLFSGHSARA